MNLFNRLIIILLILTFSCKRNSENVIEEYVKIIREYRPGEQNPYDLIIDKMNFSKNGEVYELKIQDTLFRVHKIKDKGKQVTGVALVLNHINEGNLLSLLNQKLGVSSGVNSFGQPLWKLQNGIIYLCNKYLCFRIGNEFDFAEIHNYPKMPTPLQIMQFEDNNLYNSSFSKAKLPCVKKEFIVYEYKDSLINIAGEVILSSFYVSPGKDLTYMIYLFIPFKGSPKDELYKIFEKYSMLFGNQHDVFAAISQNSILNNIISNKKIIIKESNLVFVIKANKHRKTRIDMSIWRREVFHDSCRFD